MSKKRSNPKKDPLIGQRITAIRPMTAQELKRMHWTWGRSGAAAPVVIELNGGGGYGTLLFASQDAEGNGPGEIFGVEYVMKGVLGGDFVLTADWTGE